MESLCLNHYLEGASHRLAAATQEFQSGRDVDYDTMDWLLAQVDLAVEVLAQEDVNWDANQRSQLLELLLGVANLSEYIRHSAVAAPLPD
jgi:hypothetical protein